jgi:hypothetical protein
MTTKQHERLLTNTNRGLFAALTLIGMLLDGFQVADLILELAVTLWLWMPESQSLEVAAFNWVRRYDLRSC